MRRYPLSLRMFYTILYLLCIGETIAHSSEKEHLQEVEASVQAEVKEDRRFLKTTIISSTIFFVYYLFDPGEQYVQVPPAPPVSKYR